MTSKTMRKAVILLVGLGSRLKQFITAIPKPFPLRIAKTGKGDPVDFNGLLVLPAYETRIKKAPFPRVKVNPGTFLRAVRNFLESFIADLTKSQRICAKQDFNAACPCLLQSSEQSASLGMGSWATLLSFRVVIPISGAMGLLRACEMAADEHLASPAAIHIGASIH